MTIPMALRSTTSAKMLTGEMGEGLNEIEATKLEGEHGSGVDRFQGEEGEQVNLEEVDQSVANE